MAPRVDMAVGKCQKWGLLLGRRRHAVAVGLYWAKVRATGEIIIVIKNNFFFDISLHQNGSWPIILGNYSTGVSHLVFGIVAPNLQLSEGTKSNTDQRCHYVGEIEVDLS